MEGPLTLALEWVSRPGWALRLLQVRPPPHLHPAAPPDAPQALARLRAPAFVALAQLRARAVLLVREARRARLGGAADAPLLGAPSARRGAGMGRGRADDRQAPVPHLLTGVGFRVPARIRDRELRARGPDVAALPDDGRGRREPVAHPVVGRRLGRDRHGRGAEISTGDPDDLVELAHPRGAPPFGAVHGRTRQESRRSSGQEPEQDATQPGDHPQQPTRHDPEHDADAQGRHLLDADHRPLPAVILTAYAARPEVCGEARPRPHETRRVATAHAVPSHAGTRGGQARWRAPPASFPAPSGGMRERMQPHSLPYPADAHAHGAVSFAVPTGCAYPYAGIRRRYPRDARAHTAVSVAVPHGMRVP